DVDTVGQNRDADGFERNDFSGRHTQDYVEVVDHQVEHHVDVGAALGERRQPMAFDEARRLENRTQVHNCGIKAFEMADLEDSATALGDDLEVARLFERRCHRLFKQYV